MFGWLTRKWRWRAARLLVAVYAFCMVAPAASFAFGHPIIPAHCLTGDHDAVGTIHLDQHGSKHHHSGGSDDRDGQAGKCCGLFALSAIAPAIDFVVGRQPPVSHDPLLIANCLPGQDSNRIDRPPKSHLSL